MSLSLGEIAAVVGGLVLGYLAVSVLMGGKRPQGGAPPPGAALPPPPALPPWHEVLELSSDQASLEDIQAAHGRLKAQYHPDKVAGLGGELQALAAHKTRQIDLAYQQALQARGPRP